MFQTITIQQLTSTEHNKVHKKLRVTNVNMEHKLKQAIVQKYYENKANKEMKEKERID